MNKNMLLGVAAAMGTALGAVIGTVIRQPEINKLKKQIKTLQANMAELEDVIERQNDEIARLYASYRAIGALRFLKKSEARASLKEALILQYATVEYLELVLACARGNAELCDADIHFYKAYGRLVSESDASPADQQLVESYVMGKHSFSINALHQADPWPVVRRIENYDKLKKKRMSRLPFEKKDDEEE